jgi:hypothetical protein
LFGSGIEASSWENNKSKLRISRKCTFKCSIVHF